MSRLTFTASNHTYWLASPTTGKRARVPSVSALKNALYPFSGEHYYLGVAANAICDEWDSLGQLAPTTRPRQALTIALERSARPREFGTAVHHYCEQLWTGEAIEVPDEYVPHVTNVVQWWNANGVTLIDAERLCFADADEFGAGPIAGRLDLLIKHPDLGAGLLDIKTWLPTSQGAARPAEWAFQLAGYAGMDYLVTAEGEDVPFPHLDWCGVLHVGPAEAVLHVMDEKNRALAADQVLCARALKALPRAEMEERR